jgi:tetrapyrrole methylase family protein / MazG family protein
VNWEKIKRSEAPVSKRKKYVLDSVSDTMPALMQAHKISIKAALTGFDWESTEEVWEKYREEIDEFMNCSKEPASRRKQRLEDEMGDIFFTLVNIARFYKIDPELALRKTNRKFKKRFNIVEDEMKKEHKSFSNVDIVYLEKLWKKAKKKIP